MIYKKLNTLLTKNDKRFLLYLVLFSIFIAVIEILYCPRILVQKEYKKLKENRALNINKLWFILVFQMWHEKYMEQK